MKVLIFWKPVLWLVIISYLSLMPGNEFPVIPLFNFPGFDKIVHAAFYFVLSLLLVRPFSKIVSWRYFISWLVSVVAGGIMEILQSDLTKTRHGDFKDLLANVVGATSALFFYCIFISGKRTEKYF